MVRQPRAFGYTVGDLLVQRVLLQAQGRDVLPIGLPAREPLGVWFDRHATWIEADAQGRHWLAVQYQLINSPQTLMQVALPAWPMKVDSPPGVLTVAAWPVSIAPLTPRIAFGDGDLTPLRSDRAAPLMPREPILRSIRVSALALLIVLASWAAWWLWRNHRDAENLPFAGALRDLRGLDEGSPDAWPLLHRAFDRVCGRIVTQTATLPALFARAPYLAPLRIDIERFYAQSSARFFGDEAAEATFSPLALCAQLRQLEKRHRS
ncbi:MAG TPA: calcium incorporation protein MxaA [Burkholderiaceae bacterium]|nr:calcium incorporation protein MxaA [Burkholderiaceae bacterium]